MIRGETAAGWLVGAIEILCAFGCGKDKPKPPLPVTSAAPHSFCGDGATVDPPHSELRAAFQAERSKDYAGAQLLFDALLPQYPESASLRLWRGDALLGAVDSSSGAESALAAYAEARALDARGCRLRDRERFHLALGFADAQLRQRRPEQALIELADADRQWPDSAEVHYDRARAKCLLGQVDECWADFRTALDDARSERRPRYLRAHRAPDDWLQRSQTQTEFASLRRDARYRALVAVAPPGAQGGAGP